MVNFERVHSREQIAEVARLAREIWADHYTPIIGSGQVNYMLENFQSEDALAEQIAGGYEYYLAELDGRSAGYLAFVAGEGGDALRLSKIYVRRQDRGLGVGREMLRLVEDICRARGIGMIWLTVNRHNRDSIEWYSRMGFRNAGAVVKDIGGGFVMDDFRMEKGLAGKADSASR